jgi:predicted CXXCH cytochrome family protein
MSEVRQQPRSAAGWRAGVGWLVRRLVRRPLLALLASYGLYGLGVLCVSFIVACATDSTQTVPMSYLGSFNSGAEYIGSQQCATCHAEICRDFGEEASHSGLLHPGEGELDISCESCHGPGSEHMLAGGKGKIVAGGDDPRTCFQCHAEKRAQFALPHAHPVLEGKVGCGDCHDPHGSAVKTDGLAGNHSLGDASCLECHMAQRGPHVFEHEAMLDGCTSCHEPHGSVNAKMLRIRDGNLCIQCHLTTLPQVSGEVSFGSRVHSGKYLSQGTCWSSGCHTAPHGSQVDPNLRF